MIVVTGAAGLIGANLVRALLQDGYRVRCMIRHDKQALEGLDVEFVTGDVSDPQSLTKAFRSANMVYHLAGKISLERNSWPEMEAINVVGVRNVVEACLEAGVRRLVHFSSIHAIEQTPLDRPLDESRPRVSKENSPPYDWSKAQGELEIRKGIDKGLDAIIINPTGVLGPHDYKPSYFGEGIIKMASGGMPILVNGGFTWVDARDVAKGAILAAQTAPAGASYLLAGEWRSVAEIGDLASIFAGIHPPLFSVPLWLAQFGVPMMSLGSKITKQRNIFTGVTLHSLKSNRVISHARASKDLGYLPRPFEETLMDVLNWYKENGYLNIKTEPKGNN